MNIEPLTRIDQIKVGDTLLISDGSEITATTAKIVSVSGRDGTEVIFNVGANAFFNVGMYLGGKSWAKDVRVVMIPIDDQPVKTASAYKYGCTVCGYIRRFEGACPHCGCRV
ncbi:MAG: hypothetical protein WC997_02280 [Porticoccaceae bacterium]